MGPRPSPGPDSGSGGAGAPRPRHLIQKTHAAFVSKLYAMVADAGTDSLIAWTADGDCFKVTDPPDFSREVLPVYFKHGNWQSFVRQLNMYGFHKISDLAYGGVFGDAQLWVFKHPSFRRGELKLLQSIKRRGARQGPPTTPAETTTSERPSVERPSAERPSAEPPSAEPGSGAHSGAATATAALDLPVASYTDGLRGCISALQRENADLQRENQDMRAAIESCQGAFAGIMRFLDTAVVQPATRSASAPSAARVVDAFKQLASDIGPALSRAADQPARGSFRAELSSGPALPPLRLGGGTQPAHALRVPSLSPPTTAAAPLDRAPHTGHHNARPSAVPRNRRSSRSSSTGSTSSTGNPEADDCQPQLLTHVVLPPIANMVGSIAYGHRSAGVSDKPLTDTSWMCASPHPSSLRGTLPAKRPRLD
ncbi:Flocculation suppression protein [Coemansia spiralis]|nr:Flocculation suppression protein [Coemansia spiralis]